MSCCNYDTFIFANQSTVNVAYTPSMLAAYGSRPNVEVYYQVPGGFQAAGIFTRIELEGTPINNIFIDNGGPNTGFVKIS